MSTLRVSSINNAAASAGGITIDSSGGVSGALPSPNRNLLYNGAMQVSQRGTSTTGITGDGYYTADRWKTLFVNSVGTWTQTIENDAPTGSGFQRSLRLLCTTAKSVVTTDLLGVTQQLEGQDLQRIAKGTASAQQLTLSFWVKSNVTGTYIAYLYDDTNARHVAASYTISASATWERKTVTFPADTTGAFANTNASALYVFFHLAAGASNQSGTLATSWASYNAANRAVGQVNVAAATNNYWQVTGVQLEVGPVATSFEFKSYGQELRECQRYYYQHIKGSSLTVGPMCAFSATQADCQVFFPVTMRTAPNLVASSGTDYYSFARNGGTDTFNSFTINYASTNSTDLYNASEISSTAGHAGVGQTSNALASIAFSAEL